MARRHDSMWRDSRLPLVHAGYGFTLPLSGMSLPMVEYDRGEALAVIDYMRADTVLPKGEDVGRAYGAVSRLRRPDGLPLPFLTARYDPRNWSFNLFPHNDAARDLLATDGWLPCTERHFVRLLYRLRGHHLPDLGAYSVILADAPWTGREGRLGPVGWPGQDMSKRRRAYEPEGPYVSFNLRNPCTDVDLAVVGVSGNLALTVDFKLGGAHVDPRHKTHRAMAGIRGADGQQVPSLIVQYLPGDEWAYSVMCLNAEAEGMLRDVLVTTNAVAAAWTPDEWTHVDERRWVLLLETAQGR
jgi:hypothetical protein